MKYIRLAQLAFLFAGMSSTCKANNCTLLEKGTCFENAENKIRTVSGVGSNPDSCCNLCADIYSCVSWCHVPSGNGDWSCNLYQTVGKTKQSKDGCIGGLSNHEPRKNATGPNIVFLVVESTDGRTWTPGYQNDVIPLPNIRKLQQNGTIFNRHYSNAPVCCPSRATFWSGRHASNIPHIHNGIMVEGAWNNYEGLPSNYSDRIDQVMMRQGYNVKVSGKEDWSAGGHSLNVRLNSWTMYTQFPYNVNKSGGWIDETEDCHNNGTVIDGTSPDPGDSAHKGDWITAEKTTAWIKQAAVQKPRRPFFVYQGMNIVHPPYATNQYWYSKIDPRKINVPAWPPLESLHPCDFQSSMLKGCTPSDGNATVFYSEDRRRNIRRIYYAMIAEFDAMVGLYYNAVKDAGVLQETVFIVTSDHGDMQMEHQQHYKMVPYDASASVPMVIFDGRAPLPSSRTINTPTQLIDIFPTIMDIATVHADDRPSKLDGFSLVPLIKPLKQTESEIDLSVTQRQDFVVSQFHGCNIAMSWFLIVKQINGTTYKYVVWGTGKEVPSLLFDLDSDKGEMNNLLLSESSNRYRLVVNELDNNLREVVQYDKVALKIAQYNIDSLRGWINATGPSWKDAIHAHGLRWTDSWNQSPEESIKAVEDMLSNPAKVLACRHNLTWG